MTVTNIKGLPRAAAISIKQDRNQLGFFCPNDEEERSNLYRLPYQIRDDNNRWRGRRTLPFRDDSNIQNRPELLNSIDANFIRDVH